MNLTEIVLDKISEWLNRPQLPLYLFGIFAVILFAVVIHFLRRFWTNKQSNLPDHREMIIHFAIGTNQRGQDSMAWNREISTHDRISDCTSETSSIEPSHMNNTQSTSTMEWENFVPYKYLCSCRYKKSYLARNPIWTEYNSNSKHMDDLEYE